MTLFPALVRLVLNRLRCIFTTGAAGDAEILALHHQLLVLKRQITRPHFTDVDRAILGILGSVMARTRRDKAFLIVKPDTALRWHRRRIARHWTQLPNMPRGRRPIVPQIRGFTIRLATENPNWGYRRIHGQLHRLGHSIAASTVWKILKAAGINLTRDRTGRTASPTGLWTTQAAHNLMMRLGHSHRFQYLIRDGAGQFTVSFDTVFAGSGITASRIQPRSPQATAFAERWVRTLRHELLDRTFICNEHQLRRLLEEYIERYNTQRPHRGIGQRAPNDHDNVAPIQPDRPIERTTTCAGLINQYRPAASPTRRSATTASTRSRQPARQLRPAEINPDGYSAPSRSGTQNA